MASLPDGALMQRAAAGLAYAVVDLLGSALRGAGCCCWSGSGDNGGDALYAGALLARRGAQVEAWLLSDHAHRAGLAGAAAGRGAQLVEGAAAPGRPDVVVDGIVGIGGQARAAAGRRAALALLAGSPGRRRRHAERGRASTPASWTARHVRATLTVTFGTHKVVPPRRPGGVGCGAVHLVDLGLELPDAGGRGLQPADVAAICCRVPTPDAQKYARGVVGRAGRLAPPTPAPRCWPSPERSIRAGRDGPLRRRRRRRRPGRATQHPEVVGDGRVQAWVVGSGSGDGAEGTLARGPGRRRADRRRRRRRFAARPARPRRRDPHPARRRARRHARRRARRRRGPPAGPRTARGRASSAPWCCSRGATRSWSHPDGRVRVTTTGTALAGHRRGRRRARRSDRRPRRRRPRPVRRRVGRLVAARRRRHPGEWRRSDRRERRGAGAVPGDREPWWETGGHDRPRRDRRRPRRDPAQRASAAGAHRRADDHRRQGRRLRPRHAAGGSGRARGRRRLARRRHPRRGARAARRRRRRAAAHLAHRARASSTTT